MNIKTLNAAMKSVYHAAGYTGKNVVFAVLDTGVARVGRLRGKVIGADDEKGHGTFTAGILIDWCPDALIWSYSCPYPDDITAALLDVVDRAKKTDRRVIVNASISTDAAKIKPAVDACVAAGIPLICAAGNDGREMLDQYPSCFESPITVAALQADGKRAHFSTWHGEVDLADDGVQVESIDLYGKPDKKSGTSFATPTLAGKAGLLLSSIPGMTEAELYGALIGLAVDLESAGRDPYTGYGFVRLVETGEKSEEDEETVKSDLLYLADPYMEGDKVRELQILLIKHGHSVGNAGADGKFGPDTDEAVRAFQQAKSLDVDGKVGDKTWAALRADADTVTGTITGKQLAEIFERFETEKRGYVYGAQGELYTQELAEKWHARAKAGSKSVPSGRDKDSYFIGDCSKWIGKYVDDCSGGIVDAIRQYIPDYADRTANGFKAGFKVGGTIDTLPERPGVALWYSGHIGVYMGDGYAIEFRGTDYGCVRTKVASRKWTYWGEIAGVTYTAEADDTPETPAAEPYYGVCTGGSVYVRTGPGTEYSKLGTAHEGDKLLVLPGDGWPQVAVLLDGKLVTGYMSGRYVGTL